MVDYIFEMLLKYMLRAARQAEKFSNTFSRNGVRWRSNRFNQSTELRNVVNELVRTSSGTNTSDQGRITDLRRKLRKLQQIFDNDRSQCWRIEKFSRDDRPAFWKKVSMMKKASKKRITIFSTKPIIPILKKKETVK